ncbi:MAG: hypothetical protein ACM3YO_01945 [Bacteroidota bacterium]
MIRQIQQRILRIAESILPIDARGITRQEIKIEVQNERVTIVLPRDPFGEEERGKYYRQLAQSIQQEFGYGTFVLYTT